MFASSPLEQFGMDLLQIMSSVPSSVYVFFCSVVAFVGSIVLWSKMQSAKTAQASPLLVPRTMEILIVTFFIVHIGFIYFVLHTHVLETSVALRAHGIQMNETSYILHLLSRCVAVIACVIMWRHAGAFFPSVSENTDVLLRQLELGLISFGFIVALMITVVCGLRMSKWSTQSQKQCFALVIGLFICLYLQNYVNDLSAEWQQVGSIQLQQVAMEGGPVATSNGQPPQPPLPPKGPNGDGSGNANAIQWLGDKVSRLLMQLIQLLQNNPLPSIIILIVMILGGALWRDGGSSAQLQELYTGVSQFLNDYLVTPVAKITTYLYNSAPGGVEACFQTAASILDIPNSIFRSVLNGLRRTDAGVTNVADQIGSAADSANNVAHEVGSAAATIKALADEYGPYFVTFVQDIHTYLPIIVGCIVVAVTAYATQVAVNVSNTNGGGSPAAPAVAPSASVTPSVPVTPSLPVVPVAPSLPAPNVSGAPSATPTWENVGNQIYQLLRPRQGPQGLWKAFKSLFKR